MHVLAKTTLLMFILAAASFPVESHAKRGDGDRNVDGCRIDNDYIRVISIGSNIDICIATSNWIEAIEANGTATQGNILEKRLETALSYFCGGQDNVVSGQTSTGGGSKADNSSGGHFMWVTASVVCTWM